MRTTVRVLGVVLVLIGVGVALWWPVTVRTEAREYYSTTIECGSLWIDNWPALSRDEAVAAELKAVEAKEAGTYQQPRKPPEGLFGTCDTERASAASAVRIWVGVGIVVFSLSFIPRRKTQIPSIAGTPIRIGGTYEEGSDAGGNRRVHRADAGGMCS